MANYSEKTPEQKKAKSYASRVAFWAKNGVTNKEGKTFDLNDYNRAFQIQGGKCALCDKHQSELKRALAVDHDHATGRFRGLLCSPCNSNAVGINTLETIDLVKKYLGGN